MVPFFGASGARNFGPRVLNFFSTPGTQFRARQIAPSAAGSAQGNAIFWCAGFQNP